MKSTTTKELGTCPACDKPLVATVAVETGDLDLTAGSATVEVKVTGIRLTHDCIPKETR